MKTIYYRNNRAETFHTQQTKRKDKNQQVCREINPEKLKIWTKYLIQATSTASQTFFNKKSNSLKIAKKI